MMKTDEHDRLVQEINQLRHILAKKDAQIENLKIDNSFLNTLYDGISEEIMVLDPDFNIKDVNNAFLERYNLKKAEVLGNRCYEIKEKSGSPCNLGDQSCPLINAKETGEMVEMPHYHKDGTGTLKEHILIIYPLKTVHNKIEYFMEIARDVTEYKDLIRKLQASEKRFRAILDTATDAILSIDENHRIIIFNNAAQRIFGYQSKEVLGKNLNLLIPSKYGDHREYVQKFLEKRESGMIGKTTSLTALKKSGEEFPVDLSLSFIEMGGEITFTAIIRDVSGQQQMESKLLQSERLAAVGQAVAHVAHEIRNPLMIIGGFSNQMRMSLEDDKDIKKLDMILKEVEMLERLVANLGDFTKEYRLVKRSADINSVIKDVLRILADIYSSERYVFKECLSPNMKEINCDPDKLKQVFVNIISNGLEAMVDSGTITVSTEGKSDCIEIKISDEGTGIPDKNLQHIFE
ncbi:MAG: PAS domain S-box protein, partial [Thermodesulfobacteriota bacterium]|nr:PAS domain S-box protein [Thermodesulfobacteriota bacterium]